MDYFSQIMGAAEVAHYLSDHKKFDGIRVATKRRACARKPRGSANVDRALVAIEVAEIRLS